MPADPKKPGKPCARCGMGWQAHKAGTVGTCSHYYAVWKHKKAKRVATGIERQFDNKGEK